MKLSTKTIAEIAIFGALAFALDIFQGGITRGLFPNGGSIGIAMLPILVITFRRGMKAGLLSSLILSFLQLLGGIYLSANTWYMMIFQLLLDYILAYPLVALAGIFYKPFQNAENNKQKITFLIIATIIGGLGKLTCHYLAGVIFWSSSCPEGYFGGPLLYSLIYNGSYMLPNIIINGILLIIIGTKFNYLLKPKEWGTTMNTTKLKKICLLLVGLSSTIISIILYINSFEIYKDEWGTDISFNEDYVIAILLSLVVLIYGITNITNPNNNAFSLVVTLLSSITTFYTLGVFFKAISKNKPFNENYAYLYIGIISLFILDYGIFSILENKNKNQG